MLLSMLVVRRAGEVGLSINSQYLWRAERLIRWAAVGVGRGKQETYANDWYP